MSIPESAVEAQPSLDLRGAMSPEVLAAIIAGCVALLGYPVSSLLTSRQEARAREMAFKLERYQDFLKAFFTYANEPSLETQLEFTHKVNVLNLMASPHILSLLHDLTSNYESDSGTVDRQWQILNEMLRQMRKDLLGRSGETRAGYEFPVLVSDPAAFTPRGQRK